MSFFEINIVLIFISYLFYRLMRRINPLRLELTLTFFTSYTVFFISWVGDILNNWVLTTNHRRIAVLYFLFVMMSGLAGLALATVIRFELAYPGAVLLNNNSEKYLSIVSVHGIIMVFFMIIPLIFGAFGNFLLPTQLGIRDVAFPRLNSFIFWFTPAGFVTLLHVILFDKTYDLTSWVDFTRVREVLSRSLYSPESFSNSSFLRLDHKSTMYGLRAKHLKQTPEMLIAQMFIREAIARGYWYNYIFTLQFLKGPKHYTTITGPGILGDHLDNLVREVGSSSADHLSEVYHDWRTLGYDREAWRSCGDVGLGFITWSGSDLRTFWFTDQESDKIINLVSSWIPTHLIPGWAFITPYTSRTKFSAVGKVDVALGVVFVIGLGSVISSVNYLVTYKYLSPAIFRQRRELRSFFVDGLIVGSRMIVAANPALLVAILLLLSDRHLGTSVFDFSGGGDAVLFQHLFWFFGHPEVYIIIIPCFGIVNSLLPFYLKKRLSGRLSLQYSMYTIAIMSFVVWGHHMYMVGLSNGVRSLYSTMTVMISIPASTKVIHWCVTFINSTISSDTPFLFILGFIYFFVFGGLSGMFVAHVGFDILYHDTFFVIGHFHVMLSGAAMSALFAAFYFYFSSIFGVQFNRFFSLLHFGLFTTGQILNLTPMFWLGWAGMPRRIMDYPETFSGWHSISSSGHLLTTASFFFFFVMIFYSLLENRSPVNRNLGVSRLNTRLAFFSYEVRKHSYFATKALVTPSQLSGDSRDLHSCYLELDISGISYTFK